MKRYYTIYVPEDGSSPRVGDRGIDKHGFVTSVMDEEYIREAKKMRHFDRFKRAVLALVDRELEVGDKVERNPYNWKKTDFDSWGRGEGIGTVVATDPDLDVRWPKGRCYETHDQVLKVVGRITDKCLPYVESGMEFDENDLLVLEWGGSSVRKPISMASKEAYGGMNVWVKNPNGKF